MPRVIMIVLVVVEVLEGELAYRLTPGPGDRVEEHLVVDPAVHRGDDRRGTAELAERRKHPVEIRLPHPVRLVQHDQIGDREMPVDLRVPRARRVELGGIDDLDQPPYTIRGLSLASSIRTSSCGSASPLASMTMMSIRAAGRVSSSR